MRSDQDSVLEASMERLIESGAEEMASVFAGLFNLAMGIECQRFLGAGHYERAPSGGAMTTAASPRNSISRPAR